MNPEQQMVAQFMRGVAGQEVHDTPTIRTPDIHELQFTLMHEEAVELYAAEINQDRVAIAGALGNLLYVTYNTACAHGLDLDCKGEVLRDIKYAIRCYKRGVKDGNINQVFECLIDIKTAVFVTAEGFVPLKQVFIEIHRSNMTKLWTSEEVDTYYSAAALGADLECYDMTYVDATPGKRCCRVKNQAGKLIKSPSYSPANLKPILGMEGDKI